MRLETYPSHDPLPSFPPTPPLLVLYWWCIGCSQLTLLICAGLLSHKYFKSVFSGFWKQPVSRKPVSSCAVLLFVSLTSYMTGSAEWGLRLLRLTRLIVLCCLANPSWTLRGVKAAQLPAQKTPSQSVFFRSNFGSKCCYRIWLA